MFDRGIGISHFEGSFDIARSQAAIYEATTEGIAGSHPIHNLPPRRSLVTENFPDCKHRGQLFFRYRKFSRSVIATIFRFKLLWSF
jgi:hypothetical protein